MAAIVAGQMARTVVASKGRSEIVGLQEARLAMECRKGSCFAAESVLADFACTVVAELAAARMGWCSQSGQSGSELAAWP